MSCDIDGELPLEFSPYVHCFQKGAVTVLYHSLNLKKCYGDMRLRELYGFFRNGASFKGLPERLKDESAIVYLLQEGFLGPCGCEAEEMPARALLGPTAYSTLAILLDRVSWCPDYYFGDRESMGVISPENAARGLSFFISRMEKDARCRIILVSDEPDMSIDRMRSIISNIRKSFEKSQYRSIPLISISIPGASITARLARLARMESLEVISVYVGAPAAGSEACADFCRGYEHMKRQGILPAISLPVGIDNIASLEDTSYCLVNELGCRELSLAQCRDMKPQGLSEAPSLMWAKMMVKLFSNLRSYGITVEPILGRLISFVEGIPSYGKGCNCMLTVTADGEITICPLLPEGRSGKRMPFLNEACRRCQALGICDGGCAWAAVRSGGSFTDADRSSCAVSQYLLQWMLEDLGQKMGIPAGSGSMICLPPAG